MDFKTAMYQTSLLYGVELPEDEWEEIAMVGYRIIGNKKVRLYRYTTTLDCKDNSVELPCNANEVEAVTYGFEDWRHVTNDTPNGDYSSMFTESYIEGRKMLTDPLYVSGKYAKYEQVGNILYFDKNYGKINILYKGEVLDDDGLPDINDKEARALATYVASVVKYKEGLITNNGNIIQQAQLLETRWKQQCDNARVPERLNQNDMNEILDAKTSWDRKLYNKSYKSIK